jgi:predicted phosphodiesterase
MQTIRTENKYYDYFNKKWFGYFKKRNVFGYLGHTHKEHIGLNFNVLGSCGYDLKYKDLYFGKYKIRIIADLHIGIKNIDLKFKNKILPILTSKDINKIIFLGDTFDLALTNNKEILKNQFWKWYNNNTKDCIFIVGNHDINLLKDENIIRNKILENKKSIITREYYYRGKLFCHGDKFDPLTQYFGKLYLIMFKIYDYTGKVGRFLWYNIFLKIFNKIDIIFSRKR